MPVGDTLICTIVQAPKTHSGAQWVVSSVENQAHLLATTCFIARFIAQLPLEMSPSILRFSVAPALLNLMVLAAAWVASVADDLESTNHFTNREETEDLRKDNASGSQCSSVHIP